MTIALLRTVFRMHSLSKHGLNSELKQSRGEKDKTSLPIILPTLAAAKFAVHTNYQLNSGSSREDV